MKTITIGIVLRTYRIDNKTIVYRIDSNIKELKNRVIELNNHYTYNNIFGKVNDYLYELIVKKIKIGD